MAGPADARETALAERLDRTLAALAAKLGPGTSSLLNPSNPLGTNHAANRSLPGGQANETRGLDDLLARLLGRGRPQLGSDFLGLPPNARGAAPQGGKPLPVDVAAVSAPGLLSRLDRLAGNPAAAPAVPAAPGGSPAAQPRDPAASPAPAPAQKAAPGGMPSFLPENLKEHLESLVDREREAAANRNEPSRGGRADRADNRVRDEKLDFPERGSGLGSALASPLKWVNARFRGLLDAADDPQKMVERGNRQAYDRGQPLAGAANLLGGGLLAGLRHQHEAGGTALGGMGVALGGAGKAAALIPGIGPAAAAVAQFGSLLLISTDRLRKWTDGLHQRNMEFAKDSPSMGMVEAKAQWNEIMLNWQRGERRAGAAEDLVDARAEDQRAWAPVEDWWDNTQSRVGASFRRGSAVAGRLASGQGSEQDLAAAQGAAVETGQVLTNPMQWAAGRLGRWAAGSLFGSGEATDRPDGFGQPPPRQPQPPIGQAGLPGRWQQGGGR